MRAGWLQAVSLPELIATLSDYEALAIRLAEQEDHRARVRSMLAANLPTHPLFDAERFRRHGEMHPRQHPGEAPVDFHVPAAT